MFGLNKYVIYAVIGAILLASVSTGVLVWRSSIRSQALMEFNNAQLQQVVKDQQEFMNNMRAINTIQTEILKEFNKKNNELSEKFQNLEKYLSEEETKPSVGSSEILKNTVRELSK